MTNKKHKITLLSNPNGKEFPLIIEDLIPEHSSSTKKKDEEETSSTMDFDKAVALIWNTLMESSENSTVEKTTNVTKMWEPKQVSDA